MSKKIKNNNLAERYRLPSGKYAVGNINNMFSDKELKLYNKAIPKSKNIKCGYIEKYNFYFVKLDNKKLENVLVDYVNVGEYRIDNNIIIFSTLDNITKSRILRMF